MSAATIIIHDLDEDLRAKLRARADRNGRTIEAEARAILADAVHPDATPVPGQSASADAASRSEPLTWDTVTDEQFEEIIAEGLRRGSIPAYLDHIRSTLGGVEGLDAAIPPRDQRMRVIDFETGGWKWLDWSEPLDEES